MRHDCTPLTRIFQYIHLIFQGYFAEKASPVCKYCSNSFGWQYTSAEASSSCDQCVSGYMSVYKDDGSIECKSCPAGTSCPHDKFSTVENLEVRDGQYRFSTQSEYVYVCPLEGNCAASSNVTDSCVEGSFGPLCKLCKDGWTAHTYEGKCTGCTS